MAKKLQLHSIELYDRFSCQKVMRFFGEMILIQSTVFNMFHDKDKLFRLTLFLNFSTTVCGKGAGAHLSLTTEKC